MPAEFPRNPRVEPVEVPHQYPESNDGLGMPRRIYTYAVGRGWEGYNLASSIGAATQGIAVLIFAINVIVSLRRGRVAGNDPWDAWSLEWATTSPPAEYNFETLPEVRSTRPLWDLKHPEDPDWKFE